MLRTSRKLVFFGWISFFVCSCSFLDRNPSSEEVVNQRELIGSVSSVRDGFVLLRLTSGMSPAAGSVLISQGAGRTGSLKLSGERDGPFYAADIKSGEVKAGDAVYIVRKVSKVPELPRVGPREGRGTSWTTPPPLPVP